MCAALIVVISSIGGRNALYAFEGECYVRYDNGGGVYIYLDDWTLVDSRSSHSFIVYDNTSDGASLCANFGQNQMFAIKYYLCNQYGAGHKVTWANNDWTYDDPGYLYGGPGYGTLDGGPFECS